MAVGRMGGHSRYYVTTVKHMRILGVALAEDTASETPRRTIPLQMHPRVFAALGADLVTSDVVAVIELVKNAYDAMASETIVRFAVDAQGPYIEISDNGLGMTLEIIEDVWAVVATPYRAEHVWSGTGDGRRRVSGAKGLGRLAAARLGSRLEMTTRAPGSSCWRVLVDWGAIAEASSLEECQVSVEPCADVQLDSGSGTIIRIRDLASGWSGAELLDLEENLSRLVPPFQPPESFSILFDSGHGTSPMRIEPPAFLSHPKYRLEGEFDATGTMRGTYSFEDSDGRERTAERTLTWRQVLDQAQAGEWGSEVLETPECGPFSFEIRVWDIGSADTAEIADKWGIAKNQIRKAIRAHKGLSVYRDGILVIPKSDTARDWLGLDLRRISHLGKRISTTQIVGHVQVSAEANPGLTDTSDRERLVDTSEFAQFRAMLFASIFVLENEREKDRTLSPTRDSEPTSSFFERISAEGLLKDIGDAVEEGVASPETLAIVESFSASLDKTRGELERRFVYYSRLATIGTIAQMLMHEIRNRTSILQRFILKVDELVNPMPEKLVALHAAAARSVGSLESLATTFAPLANRRFKRGARSSNLHRQTEACIELFEQDAKRLGATIENAIDPEADVAIDPGELDAILINLISNAVYWLDGVPGEQRRIRLASAPGERDGRLKVLISDSGPGIGEDDLNAVMEPGFTLKPDGIGMGLTVAAEIVNDHGGRLGLASPGELGGATLEFDLPSK